tara:strand:- start:1755 stop:3569 length:1815 start_codon:yes stop_codon:yes gene_type:complete
MYSFNSLPPYPSPSSSPQKNGKENAVSSPNLSLEKLKIYTSPKRVLSETETKNITNGSKRTKIDEETPERLKQQRLDKAHNENLALIFIRLLENTNVSENSFKDSLIDVMKVLSEAPLMVGGDYVDFAAVCHKPDTKVFTTRDTKSLGRKRVENNKIADLGQISKKDESLDPIGSLWSSGSNKHLNSNSSEESLHSSSIFNFSDHTDCDSDPNQSPRSYIGASSNNTPNNYNPSLESIKQDSKSLDRGNTEDKKIINLEQISQNGKALHSVFQFGNKPFPTNFSDESLTTTSLISESTDYDQSLKESPRSILGSSISNTPNGRSLSESSLFFETHEENFIDEIYIESELKNLRTSKSYLNKVKEFLICFFSKKAEIGNEKITLDDFDQTKWTMDFIKNRKKSCIDSKMSDSSPKISDLLTRLDSPNTDNSFSSTRSSDSTMPSIHSDSQKYSLNHIVSRQNIIKMINNMSDKDCKYVLNKFLFNGDESPRHVVTEYNGEDILREVINHIWFNQLIRRFERKHAPLKKVLSENKDILCDYFKEKIDDKLKLFLLLVNLPGNMWLAIGQGRQQSKHDPYNIQTTPSQLKVYQRSSVLNPFSNTPPS